MPTHVNASLPQQSAVLAPIVLTGLPSITGFPIHRHLFMDLARAVRQLKSVDQFNGVRHSVVSAMPHQNKRLEVNFVDSSTPVQVSVERYSIDLDVHTLQVASLVKHGELVAAAHILDGLVDLQLHDQASGSGNPLPELSKHADSLQHLIHARRLAKTHDNIADPLSAWLFVGEQLTDHEISSLQHQFFRLYHERFTVLDRDC